MHDGPRILAAGGHPPLILGPELFLLEEPAEPTLVHPVVRVALLDPALGGAGIARLRAAGAEVQVGGGAEAAERMLGPWRRARAQGRPDVLLKLATSLDGRIATRTGESQWITGEQARARGRALRGEVDAILVGAGTVRADDPSLTARTPGCPDPVRVVLDGRARVSLDRRLVKTAHEVPTVVFAGPGAPEDAIRRLEAAGVDVESASADGDGRLDLGEVLGRLFSRGLLTVLVEGGAQVAGSFLDAGLVDRVAWFVAPMLIGGVDAAPALAGRGAVALADALVLRDVEVERLGPDLLVTGRA